MPTPCAPRWRFATVCRPGCRSTRPGWPAAIVGASIQAKRTRRRSRQRRGPVALKRTASSAARDAAARMDRQPPPIDADHPHTRSISEQAELVRRGYDKLEGQFLRTATNWPRRHAERLARCRGRPARSLSGLPAPANACSRPVAHVAQAHARIAGQSARCKRE